MGWCKGAARDGRGFIPWGGWDVAVAARGPHPWLDPAPSMFMFQACRKKGLGK